MILENSGYKRKAAYWCPECNNLMDDEIVFINPLCQCCGAEMVDIDLHMIPVIYEIFESEKIKTVECCEGHWIEDENGKFKEYKIPYLIFKVHNYSTKFNDLFANCCFPALANVSFIREPYPYIKESDDFYIYKMLKNFNNNEQANFNVKLEMNCYELNLHDTGHIKPSDIFNNRKNRFIDQLYKWAVQLTKL